MTRIAVHLVTYNSARTLELCLESLKTQTVEYDLFAVDNASTDDTAALLKAWNVPHIISPVNLGYSGGHNLALQQTRSDYVLTLNPDVVLMPDYLEKLAAALDEHPDCGAAVGTLIRVDDLNEPINGAHHLDGAGLFMRRTRRQGLRLEGKPIPPPDTAPVSIFGPDGAAAFYRRSMLDDIAIDGEIFDVDFFLHREDIDLCWRMQWRGWSALWISAAKAKHIRTFRPGQRTRAGVNDTLRRLSVRNRYLLMIKDDVPLWRDLPYIFAYDFGILAYILLRERTSLPAYPAAWKLLGKMLAKRKAIRAGRRVTAQQMAHWFEGAK